MTSFTTNLTTRWTARDQFHRSIRRHRTAIEILRNGSEEKFLFDSNSFRFTFRSFKQDEPMHLEQPSSFDILDFCYSILVGTFDLLRRLTIKNSLQNCLQLNNSICQIIDLFVKHNYGLMNVRKSRCYFFLLLLMTIEMKTLNLFFFSLNIIQFFIFVYIRW